MNNQERIYISENEKYRRAAMRTPEERYALLMRLIRIGKMLDEARKTRIEGNIKLKN